MAIELHHDQNHASTTISIPRISQTHCLELLAQTNKIQLNKEMVLSLGKCFHR